MSKNILPALLGLFIGFSFYPHQANARPVSADLSIEFEKAIGDLPKGWDGTSDYGPVVDQGQIDACQSFALVAQLEYILYSQTGTIVKLSEKYMAYSLIKNMITLFWQPDKKSYMLAPGLGYGVAPFMIDTVLKYGMMTEQDYPWGDLSSTSGNGGSKSLDVSLYKSTFESPTQSFTPDQYSSLLDQTFLSAPPSAFYYDLSYFNYASGKPGDAIFRNPNDFSKYLNLQKGSFTILYNQEFNPQIGRESPSDLKQDMQSFGEVSDMVGLKTNFVTSDQMLQAILTSLENKMVVGFAANVWGDSWYTPTTNYLGGGHAAVIVGYQEIDGVVSFKIRNSWGPSKGVNGYNFIKASDLLPNMNYAMTYQQLQ